MTGLTSSFSDAYVLQILESSKDASAIYISEDLHIRFANDGMLRIWGKDRNVIGKTLEQALPEMEGQPFAELLKNVWRSGEAYIAKDTPATMVIDGRAKTSYFDFEYIPVLDTNGETTCIFHRASDVTDRRTAWGLVAEKERNEQTLNQRLNISNRELAEANAKLIEVNRDLNIANKDLHVFARQLADSREHFRNLLEQAPLGICVLSGEDMIIELANPAILKIWGRNAEDVIGKPHQSARPELQGQPVYRWLSDVYRYGIIKTNKEFRVMLYHEGGLREAYVNSVYQPLKSAQGDITGIMVIIDEITEQVLARKESERIKNMLALAIEAGDLGTFYYDPSTNYFSANDVLKQWFGLNVDAQIELTNAIERIAPRDRERVSNAILRAVSGEGSGYYEEEYTLVPFADEEARIVRATGRAFFDDEGNAISLNGTVQDITERKKDEQRKNDFIGMVSHELKTPLTSLSAYVQILLAKAKNADDSFTVSSLEKAQNQVRKMTAMINGFLNVSRLESGKIHMNMKWFDMADLLLEIKAEVEATVSTHHITFGCLPATEIQGDRDKIGQVIQNLINNAVKYTPLGSNVKVTCEAVPDGINFRVKDEGPGIALKDQEFVFDRYYRASNESHPYVAGFGIGLYLCKEIIQHHKGKIWVDSEPDKGATFCFWLPAGQ